MSFSQNIGCNLENSDSRDREEDGREGINYPDALVCCCLYCHLLIDFKLSFIIFRPLHFAISKRNLSL